MEKKENATVLHFHVCIELPEKEMGIVYTNTCIHGIDTVATISKKETNETDGTSTSCTDSNPLLTLNKIHSQQYNNRITFETSCFLSYVKKLYFPVFFNFVS